MSDGGQGHPSRRDAECAEKATARKEGLSFAISQPDLHKGRGPSYKSRNPTSGWFSCPSPSMTGEVRRGEATGTSARGRGDRRLTPVAIPLAKTPQTPTGKVISLAEAQCAEEADSFCSRQGVPCKQGKAQTSCYGLSAPDKPRTSSQSRKVRVVFSSCLVDPRSRAQ